MIFVTFNTFSQAEKYYIKITEDKFVVEKDSCNNIMKISLLINKGPQSFSFFYEYKPNSGLVTNKYYVKKDEVDEFKNYDWLITSDKISVFTNSSSLKKDKIFFVQKYNSEFYEVFATAVEISVE